MNFRLTDEYLPFGCRLTPPPVTVVAKRTYQTAPLRNRREEKKKKKVSCELVFYFISQMPSKESEAPVIIFSVDIINDDDGENLITMMMLMIQ